MFFQLLFIHLFRPFLRYKPPNTILPAHVSPRKMCTQAANMISKLIRLYKRTHGLRQIVNIAVYILHSACTIHLLNIPEKNAERDIVHGAKHLEEIAESWLCARKTLNILHAASRRWNIELPKEAEKVFARAEAKFGLLKIDQPSPKSETSPPMTASNLQSLGFQNQPQQQREPSLSSKGTSFPLSLEGFNTPSAQLLPTTSSTLPDLTRPSASISIPPQRQQAHMTNLNSKPHRQSYPLLASQQQLWNNDRAQRGPSVSQANPQTLFGGVESLVQDNQDWWYKDPNQLYANWNDVGSEPILNTNVAPNGVPVEYGAKAFGINGTGYGV